jgi:hypothetical protein
MLHLIDTIWYPDPTFEEYAKSSSEREGFRGAKRDSFDPTKDLNFRLVYRRILSETLGAIQQASILPV